MRYVVKFSRDYQHPATGHTYPAGSKLIEGSLPLVVRHHRSFLADLYRYYAAKAYPVEISVVRDRVPS